MSQDIFPVKEKIFLVTERTKNASFHRKNILRRRYTFCGNSANGKLYFISRRGQLGLLKQNSAKIKKGL